MADQIEDIREPNEIEELKQKIQQQELQLLQLNNVENENTKLKQEYEDVWNSMILQIPDNKLLHENEDITVSQIQANNSEELDQYQKLQLLINSINIKQFKNVKKGNKIINQLKKMEPNIERAIRMKRFKTVSIKLCEYEQTESIYQNYCADMSAYLKEIEQLIRRIKSM